MTIIQTRNETPEKRRTPTPSNAQKKGKTSCHCCLLPLPPPCSFAFLLSIVFPVLLDLQYPKNSDKIIAWTKRKFVQIAVNLLVITSRGIVNVVRHTVIGR